MRDWWLNNPSEQGYKHGTKPKKTDPDKQPKQCSRQHVNKQMKRLLRVVKWGVSHRIVPVTVYQELKCVEPLKRGRTEAPETEPVTPVAQQLVETTLPHLTQVLADMIRFQQLTGCRPGEVCTIRPGMIDRSGEDSYRNKYRNRFDPTPKKPFLRARRRQSEPIPRTSTRPGPAEPEPSEPLCGCAAGATIPTEVPPQLRTASEPEPDAPLEGFLVDLGTCPRLLGRAAEFGAKLSGIISFPPVSCDSGRFVDSAAI